MLPDDRAINQATDYLFPSMQLTKKRHTRVVRYFGGETIFTEGSRANNAYIIASGEVELSVIREGLRIQIDILGRGQSLGETELVTDQTRTVTATASSYVELYVVDKKRILDMVNHNPLIRSMVLSLGRRLSHLHDRVTQAASVTHPIIATAECLHLLAQAKRNTKAERRAADSATITLDYNEVRDSLKRILGMSDHALNRLLREMNQLHLIHLQRGRKTWITVKDSMLEQAASVVEQAGDALGDRLAAEYEFLEPQTTAELVDVPISRLLRKLARGELAEEAFIFRKSVITSLLDDKGKAYFERIRPKRADEFEGIEDLEYLDLETLQQVLNGLDPYRLAMLLKSADPSTVDRIMSLQSQRRCQILQDSMNAMQDVDRFEFEALEAEVLEQIKAIKSSNVREVGP